MTPQDPLRREPHETHVCRDCGAEITLPYARPDASLEGYWEKAYWSVVPKLTAALTLRGPFPGWQLDPDPLTFDEPEPPKPVRATGCTPIAVLVVLILALSGVPGVVAGGVGPTPRGAVQPRVYSRGVSPLAAERHLGAPEVSGDTTLTTVEPRFPEVGAGAPSSEVGTVLLGGFATWYDTPGYTAAAGPALRDVLGDWRGRYVTVEAGDRSVVVRLTDWCACGERRGLPTLLDLSRSAFAALADPARGVVRVSIEIDGSPRPDEADDRMRVEDGGPLPQTDTAP